MEIKYASDGIPQSVSVEGIHATPECLNAKLFRHIEPFRLNIKSREDLKKAGERLETLSKKLSVEDLKKRGIAMNCPKTLGIKEVREITFDSIPESRFFTEEQREKAKVWFENKEELEKTIEDYANGYPYDLFFYKCEFHNTRIADDKPQTVTSTEQPGNRHVRGTCFVPRTDTMYETWKKLRGKIETSPKNMLLYGNGKEKVILLLLLDDATPPDHHLKWRHDDDNINGSYQPNTICTFDVDGNGERRFCRMKSVITCKCTSAWFKHPKLSNEVRQAIAVIGQCPSVNPIPIPSETREIASVIDGSLFLLFDKSFFEYPSTLSPNKIFSRVRLSIRWHTTAEISNILGVYFNGNSALSDICELRRICYTHSTKTFGNRFLENFGTLPETQTF